MSKQVDVILIQNVKGLGSVGDERTVKLGYFNNFLSPQGFALYANSQNRNYYNAIKRKLEKKIAEEHKSSEGLKSEIDGKSITIAIKAQENGKLYGSVNPALIVATMAEQNQITIEKRQLSLPGAIKEIGEYTIEVNLPQGIIASFELHVNALADTDS